MKWKRGDRLVNPKRELVSYLVLDHNEENYLISINQMSLRLIVPKRELESSEWTIIKGVVNAQQKNTVGNNQKSPEKSGGTKANCGVRKGSKIPNNRVKPSGSPAVNGGRPSVHRKPRARNWWKRKKKAACNTPQLGPDKNL